MVFEPFRYRYTPIYKGDGKSLAYWPAPITYQSVSNSQPILYHYGWFRHYTLFSFFKTDLKKFTTVAIDSRYVSFNISDTATSHQLQFHIPIPLFKTHLHLWGVIDVHLVWREDVLLSYFLLKMKSNKLRKIIIETKVFSGSTPKYWP